MTSMRYSLAALAAVLVLAATPARAGEPGDFDDWANQPREPFTQGAESLRQVRERLLKSYYRSDITPEDLDRAAARGMLAFVDAKSRGWNKLLSPAEYAELQTDLKGQLVGIGVVIDFDAAAGLVNVNGILPHSPAAAADVREGDKILSVDGQTFKGKQMRDVVYAMRGKQGTSVRLALLRDAQVLEKTISRARISYDPVSTLRLPGDILLLQISAFVDTTPAGVKAALEEAARSHVRGIVLDLRGNSGGALDRSLETAQLFVPRGQAIGVMIKRGGAREKLVSQADPVVPQVPMAVLVNGDTRSSAELMAAALRESLTAPTIGTKTYGKWSAQALEELPNHYVMKYTVGLFQTASGKSYDGQGMPPDVEVALDDKALDRAERTQDPQERLAVDVQLRAAYNLLRMHR